MSLQKALEALKRQDFEAARRIMGRQDMAGFAIQHFLAKGLPELALKDWAAAEKTFAAATEKFPDYALFWLNRGIAEEKLDLLDEAIVSQERCKALNPKQAEAYGNLANLYRHKKRFAESEEMARQALALGGSRGDALNCLGLALGKQYKFEEAEEVLKQAQIAAPEDPDIRANRANLLLDMFRFEEAWPLFAEARAIKDKGVFRHDEALGRLTVGDYERGLRLFEARLEFSYAMRVKPAFARWNGESLEGKRLLIVAEQGFGDVIQFCRYAKFIEGGTVYWSAPKPLVRLLSGAVRGTVLDEKERLPICDYYVPVISLALATGHLRPEWDGNYLSAGGTPALPAGKHKKKIGLVWAGSRTHGRDFQRSMKLEQLRPLLQSVEADFYAAFLGEALQEISSELLPNTPTPCPLPRGEGEFREIIRLDHLITDFADTAALLKQMDCLVTVDTSVAHVAGALGVRTYLMLARGGDWRWGLEGDKTPWYPSMVLVRQDTYGDWAGVVEKVVALLKDY